MNTGLHALRSAKRSDLPDFSGIDVSDLPLKGRLRATCFCFPQQFGKKACPRFKFGFNYSMGSNNIVYFILSNQGTKKQRDLKKT